MHGSNAIHRKSFTPALFLLMTFLSCQSHKIPQDQKAQVSFRQLSGYFFRTDRQVPKARFCTIGNAETFDSLFGAAAVMGPGGLPDSIDFSREFIIAMIEAESRFETQFIIDSLTSKGATLTAAWSVLQGDSLTFSILPVQLLAVDRRYNDLTLVTRRRVVGPH